MDIQSFLRLKGLFGGGANLAQPGLDTSNPDPSSNMPGLVSPPDNTPPDSTNSDLLGQYTPRHAVTDQYTDTLTNMPERPQPGNLRRVAASIAGLGAGSSAMGIAGGQPIGFKFNPTMADQASDKVNYPDYDNQLNDWMLKTKALGMGATEEDRANTGEVKRLAGDADRDVKQQKLGIEQQKIDIGWQKEQDIFNTKAAQLQADVIHKTKLEEIALKNANTRENDAAARRAYEEARNAATNARTEMQGLIADHKLAEEKMQHAKTNAELAFRREMANRQTNITQTLNDQGQVTGRQTITKPIASQILTNPDTGEQHDTRGWSAYDIQQARARGWY